MACVATFAAKTRSGTGQRTVDTRQRKLRGARRQTGQLAARAGVSILGGCSISHAMDGHVSRTESPKKPCQERWRSSDAASKAGATANHADERHEWKPASPNANDANLDWPGKFDDGACGPHATTGLLE
jgi:hypothetical protein